MTPADIAGAITKDAVRLAFFDGRKKVGQKDIDKAFLEQQSGMEMPIEEFDEEQRRVLAYHEAGHAIAQVLHDAGAEDCARHHCAPQHRQLWPRVDDRHGGAAHSTSESPGLSHCRVDGRTRIWKRSMQAKCSRASAATSRAFAS